MTNLSTLIEFARNGKQDKASLLSQSLSKTRARGRGAILGSRSSNERPAAKKKEDFLGEEEAVLTALLELPARDLVLPLRCLSERVLPDDVHKLQGDLHRMQERGVITISRNAEGELGAKLTLKGAVIALYGDWLFESFQSESKPLNLMPIARLHPTPLKSKVE